MRTRPPPGSRRVIDWIGRRVRLLRDIRTTVSTIPRGATGRVTAARSGISVDFDACPHCGVGARVRDLAAHDVEVIA